MNQKKWIMLGILIFILVILIILIFSDSGKKCNDNNECEGACIAILSHDEKQTLEDYKGSKGIKKTGKCVASISKIEKLVIGCNAYVQGGYVYSILCVD